MPENIRGKSNLLAIMWYRSSYFLKWNESKQPYGFRKINWVPVVQNLIFASHPILLRKYIGLCNHQPVS